MLYVLDKFRVCEDMDFEDQGAIVGLMKDVVTFLKKDQIPYEKYGLKDIEKYCRSLVELQRTEKGIEGSWSVSPKPDETPEDEQVDFHYFPTYLGVAALTLVKIKYPDIANDIEGYDDSLKKGMEYAVSNNFNGFGFNSYFQRLEAAILLSKGDVPQFLLDNPEYCPKLLKELIKVRKEVVEAAEKREYINEFGINMVDEFKAVILGLYPLKNCS